MNEIGFFAYSSTVASSGECIEEAIKKINSSREVEIHSWKKLTISGNLIISKVLEAIDNCNFFCADLTGLNDNVLFELGYAIAKRKPIFLINDTSHTESERRFNELGLLTTIGYCRYSNTQDIIDQFYKERPFDPSSYIWDSLLETLDTSESRTALLILNSQIDTNYNQEVVNQTKHFKLPTIIDDASESKVQPISWYVQQLHNVPAVLAQFSATSRMGHEVHNAKCALISGLALGRDLRIKMIAEKPYNSPLDFRELLEKFSNRTECAEIVKGYLKPIQKEIGELLVKRESTHDLKHKRSELQRINFGEAIAEHESSMLSEYYLETTAISTLIKNEYNIVIGRKGTGKTATLYYLENELRQDKRNHVILIKPINFEVDGLISLMEESNNEFERGFLIECIWKFLIYSEVAKFLYESIKDKALYAITDNESSFVEYVKGAANIFLSDFSTRLEEQIKILKDNRITEIGSGKNAEYKHKVSEILHQSTLLEIKEHLAKIIPKNNKLIVLIDNLDKSWRSNSKINILSKYILGLLGVSGRIVKELSFVKSLQTNIAFHLTIFLRSDIYRHVMLNAREPDKIEISKLKWEDKELLFRIIEDRFVVLSGGKYSINDFWTKFITDKVEGIDVKDYIMNIIFPRPRDVIYLFKAAKDIAVSRGHLKIEEADIKAAYKEYSAWVFKSIIVENGITIRQMEEFMYELLASNAILSQVEIIEHMDQANIDSSTDEKVEKFIDHLVDLTILGREVRIEGFDFEYDIDSSKKMKLLAMKIGTKRYKIHNALIPYLECVN